MRLWADSEPTQVALSATDLESFGVLGFQEEPPGAALILALVRTGAELVAETADARSLPGAGVASKAVTLRELDFIRAEGPDVPGDARRVSTGHGHYAMPVGMRVCISPPGLCAGTGAAAAVATC
ncbi:hypothetical protein GCM10018966_040490 [Streptomyces yanii]